MPVTGFEIVLRRPLADGRAFGDVGPYEELRGRIHLAVDPANPANRAITDLALAPRDAAGRVRCAADVSVLLPVDRARASGRVLVDVVNRGNVVSLPNFNHAARPTLGLDSDPHPAVDAGDGWLMRRGWVVASCGWQCDLPPGVRGLFRLDAPEALDAGGRRLTGRVYVQLQAPIDVPHFLLSDRGHAPYEAADLDERDALLVVRDQPDGEPEAIPRSRWRFARLDSGRVVPDARHVYLDGGFSKGRLYQVAYTAVGARLVSLGMVALRDCAAWLRYGGAGEDNPAAGVLRHAYAYGRSQTGRLLRTMVHHDVNVDESGRRAFDGVLANVAGAMLGEFNDRFGQNSKDRGAMMDHYEPLHVTPRGGLKVFFTNTSFEYHRGDASLVHTDATGTSDVDPGPGARVYHFTGTEHALGVWPPSDEAPPAADVRGWTERSQHLRSVVNYGRLLRACLANLDRWVTEGVAPPPSRHPRIADATAVDPDELAKTFDRLPVARYPSHHPRPQRQDWSTLPPKPGPACGTRVSAVDEDGNERAGVTVPEITVPLATHSGWNLRHPEIGGPDQMLYFAGATLPFARTRAERESTGDPRLSIAERYRSREDYLTRVREAARALAAERYMLEEDVELSVSFAARMWDVWV
jgi:alpha/beta hydrolase family protein